MSFKPLLLQLAVTCSPKYPNELPRLGLTEADSEARTRVETVCEAREEGREGTGQGGEADEY